MAFLIRPAAPTDHAALAEQFLGLNRDEEPFAGNRRTDPAAGADCLAAALRRVERTGGAALVAERAARVVGHLFLTFEMDAAYVREPLRPYAYVSELYVREEMRGQGIGRALLLEAERQARARGIGRLMIGVLAGNARAEALYRRMGFAPHAIEMAKRLS